MTFEPEIWKTAGALAVQLLVAVRGAVILNLRQFARIRKHRRDVAFLETLDDRMLRDIGLTRSDLRCATSEPFWRDPGPILVSRAGWRGTTRAHPTLRRGGSAVRAPSIVPGLSGGADVAVGSRSAAAR